LETLKTRPWRHLRQDDTFDAVDQTLKTRHEDKTLKTRRHIRRCRQDIEDKTCGVGFVGWKCGVLIIKNVENVCLRLNNMRVTSARPV